MFTCSKLHKPQTYRARLEGAFWSFLFHWFSVSEKTWAAVLEMLYVTGCVKKYFYPGSSSNPIVYVTGRWNEMEDCNYSIEKRGGKGGCLHKALSGPRVQFNSWNSALTPASFLEYSKFNVQAMAGVERLRKNHTQVKLLFQKKTSSVKVLILKMAKVKE